MSLINKEDFKENEKSYSLIKKVGDSGLSIYFKQQKNEKGYRISAYANGFPKEKHICSGIDLEKCNEIWREICEKFVFLQSFVDTVDLKDFVESIRNKYAPQTKQSRFREKSDDGVIECFVKKDSQNQDAVWIARVIDYKKGTNEKTQCNICPPFATEEEAEEMCKSTLNDYNLQKGYPTIRPYNRGVELEHEIPIDAQKSLKEFFVYGDGVRTDISEIQYTSIMNILYMGK